MNIYLHELKSMRKTTIIWVLSMIALAAIYFSVFPGIQSDASEFKNMLSSYPVQVRAALGVSIDSVTSLLGFYSMVISIIILCGAIQAMNIGVSLLSKEARERTADFLLVKPVSRTAIVSAKLLAALTILLITNILYDAVAMLMASAATSGSYDQGLFLMISVTLFFVQLIFLALGAAISVFFQKLHSVLPLSLGVVFGFYMIGALLATGKDDGTRFLSPFKYFDPFYITKHASFETPYLVVSAVVVVVAVAVTYFVYTKKDIHAVS